ncbi:MAG: uroporphyrinogen-III synthase [Flavisolibacter sp.]
MEKFRLLSTRKLNPLIARELSGLVDLMELDFISILPSVTAGKTEEIMQLAGEEKAVAFTSAHAVEVVDEILRSGKLVADWRIFCLAGKTKDAIRNSSQIKNNLEGEANDAASLAGKILETKVKEIIFFCGNQRREELPSLLLEKKVSVKEFVVYETLEKPVAVKNDFDGVLFFSPSAVRSFFSSNILRPSVVCFAVGQTTATSIGTYTGNQILVSEIPSQEKMLELVRNFIHPTL